MRTRVKICGITREQDAEAAVENGVDAIGFVFYEPSPRHITVERAAAIARLLPPFVTTVALFVNGDWSSDVCSSDLAELAPRIVLAGGLSPENVGDAVRRVKPYAVDVSGGVEAAKGIKDRQKNQSLH